MKYSLNTEKKVRTRPIVSVQKTFENRRCHCIFALSQCLCWWRCEEEYGSYSVWSSGGKAVFSMLGWTCLEGFSIWSLFSLQFQFYSWFEFLSKGVLSFNIALCYHEQASFKITLDVPKELMALSNMPVLDEKLNGNIKTVYFEESPYMSTYLVAFVIGLFDYIEDTTAEGLLCWSLSFSLY